MMMFQFNLIKPSFALPLTFILLFRTQVPIVILKTKDMRNSTNIFLINLSVADLLVLLICTPTVLVEVNTKPETWVLGERMCKSRPRRPWDFWRFFDSSLNMHMRSWLGFIHLFMSFFRWCCEKTYRLSIPEGSDFSHIECEWYYELFYWNVNVLSPTLVLSHR